MSRSCGKKRVFTEHTVCIFAINTPPSLLNRPNRSNWVQNLFHQKHSTPKSALQTVEPLISLWRT